MRTMYKLIFPGCICLFAGMQNPCHASASEFSDTSKISPQQTPAAKDGEHDFDFHIGSWKTHLKRLQHPLTGSTTWVEYDGTTEVRKIWGGRANLVELEVDGPAGHIEGLNLRLYNPEAKQWSLNFAGGKAGVIGTPTVGEFKNGRGEFYDQETYNSRTILVRFIISDITADSVHFEQSFSDDGGKTWEANWIATDTRVKEPMVNAKITSSGELEIIPSATSSQHDFDFLVGKWAMTNKRLKTRLNNCTEWIPFKATGDYDSILNGIGNIDIYKSSFNPVNKDKSFEGITVRLYNPQTKLWSLYWADSNDGTMDPPVVGSFEGNIGKFYCKDTFNGKPILVMFKWVKTDKNNYLWSQAFSPDNGMTWETNSTSVAQRVK